MGRWVIESRNWQQILTHYCDQAHQNDMRDALAQDIGGGYVRCSLCSDKFLPASDPSNPRIMLRLKRANEPL